MTPSITFNRFVEPLLKDLNISNLKIFSIKDFYDYIIESYISEKYHSKKWRGIYTGGYSTESHENQTSKNFISGKYFSYDCKVIYQDDDLLPKDVVDYFYSLDFFDSIMVLESIKINPLTPARIKAKSFEGKARILETLFDAKTLMLFPKYDRIPGIIHKCELYAITLLFLKRCGNKKYSAENQLNQDSNQLLDFNMYFIDEAQDLSVPEYSLLKVLGSNQKKKVFNLFGDVNQTISNTGIKEWKSVSNCIGDLTKFEYNKNYRNTTQIVDFVTAECNVQMEKVGMEGTRVKQIKVTEIEEFILKNLKLRSVVVVSNKLIKKFKEMYSPHKNLFKTVKDIKGIEYDSVCVVLEELTTNEKYIALTRALSNLYIIK